jgi:uncharacterized protein YbjT (DUF2867 family)
MTKIVAVHGATGQQGGGVVRALSKAGFTIRALVRDVSARSATEIGSLPGVELVAVDLTKPASIVAAYTGVDAVFACTPYLGDEVTQGQNMADAAKATDVGLFVWSSLVSVTELSQGRLTAVVQFDDKHKIAEYIKSIGIPATILILGCFSENYINFPGQASYDKDKNLITLRYGAINADVAMPMLRSRIDVGNAVLTIVQNQEAFTGKTIHLGDEQLSTLDQARIVSAISGRKVIAPNSATDSDKSASFIQNKIADEMYEFFNTVEMGGLKGLVPDPLLKQYGFKASTFEDFVKEELLPYLGL